MIEALAATAALRSTPEAAEWLRAQLDDVRTGFHAAFAQVGRKLGKTPITHADAERITRAGLLVAAGMGADECARGALVLARVWALPDRDQLELVRDLFRHGDARERCSVVRVLAALPEPRRFAELAAEASRTQTQAVFEALACDNSYPARWLPDEPFVYFVLKAISLGISPDRVDGLATRWNPDAD